MSLDNFWRVKPFLTSIEIDCEECGARWEQTNGLLTQPFECVEGDERAVGVSMHPHQWKRVEDLDAIVEEGKTESLLQGMSYPVLGAVLFGVGLLLATLLSFLLVTIPLGIGLMIAGVGAILYGFVKMVVR